MNRIKSWRGIAPPTPPFLLAVLSSACAVLLLACASDPAARAGDPAALVGGDQVSSADTQAGRDPGAVAAAPAAAESQAPAATNAAPPDAGTAQADANEVPTPAASGVESAPPPTDAELDYAAIYGGAQDPYDPVADPTLPTPVELPLSYDPWEPMNRRIHSFNNFVDRAVAKPLAKAYIAVVPQPVRRGVGNFFNNLGQPRSAVNALLQGRPGHAGQSLMRFMLNSTVGVAGLFDPATRLNIPNRSEDFGQTLGAWGWGKSRYVELPLFGPRTVRDVVGLIGDAPLSPVLYVQDNQTRVFLEGLNLVDTRTQLMSLDHLREGAADDYALIRDGWLQRRNYQIQQDSKRNREEDEQLPDYLRDDIDNPTPTVPTDVIPIIPTAPGS